MRVPSLLPALVALIRRSTVWVWILAALVAGGLILLCGLVILDGKKEADRQADQATANIADTVAHDTARTFEMLDLSLQGAIHVLADPETTLLTGRARQLALFDYSTNAIHVNAVLVVDETGKIVDDSNSLLVPPKDNLSEKEYFRVHKDNPDAGLYISHPFRSHFQDGEWNIAISRRISKPDGSFGGIVIGSLQLSYFSSLFANLSLDSGAVVTLFQSDGTHIAQKPFRLMEIGRNLSNLDLFKYYPASNAGHFEASGNSGGVRRRFAFQQVGSLPLVVSVGFSLSDIYGPWRQKVLLIAALMAALAVTILALAVLLFRQFTQRKIAHSRLRDAFDTIPVGLVLYDEQDRAVLWNKPYAKQRASRNIAAGVRYEDALRKNLSEGVISEAIGHEEEWLEERLAQHKAPVIDFVMCKPGNRWLRIIQKPTADGGKIGVRIDVTDLKRSEESFRLLLEKNPLPMWVCDHESLRFLAVNEAAIEHYGYSRVAFLAMTVLDIRPPEERRQAKELFGTDQSTYKGGKVWRHIKADGTEIEVAIYRTTLQFHGREASVTAAIDVTEQREAERRLVHYARHDSLTNLANLVAFSEHIESALARVDIVNKPFALLCLDLDRFKEINDGFGHSVGDELLREVARRLKAAAEGAFIARKGGDEFAVVAEDITSSASASQIADQIHAAMAQTFVINGHSLHIGVSIGIAMHPTDGCDEQTLLSNADAAMYRAKTAGRGITHFFQPEMDQQLRKRHAMQNHLDGAIARNELSLYYQPQAKIGGEIFGFEALVRWHHQELGMVGPDVFIPLAEETGFVLRIGEWVLREACREAASWPNALSVAVNISPIQFRQSDLPALVLAILIETGLAPHRLELEMTEGVMINDHAGALAILRRIKALGVRIAMDDFGSGYSSLSYLHSFPFDKIKIDQSFIANLGRNPQAAAIIRAVIGLCRGLQLPIIAEGVETEEQLAFLMSESCDEIQGYLLGHPRPIADYAQIVGRARTEDAIRRAQLSLDFSNADSASGRRI